MTFYNKHLFQGCIKFLTCYKITRDLYFRSRDPCNPTIIIAKNHIIIFLVLFNKKTTLFLPKILNSFCAYNINMESIKLGDLYLSKKRIR